MSDSDDFGYYFNPQLPTILGFLGSLTFASMVLMMQLSDDLSFKEILITITGVTSFLFIISAISGSIDEGHGKLISKNYMKFVKQCYWFGLIGLLAIFPLIIFSFSPVGSIIVLGVEVITFGLFMKLVPKPKYLD